MKDLAKLRVEQADTRQRGEQAQEEVCTSTVCISLFLPGDYDGSGQQSCKCNYVDFSK